ncbi:hypothetical protein QJS04_geneDACA004846 [Acorus gramineus]|uniref:Uncharacterized protein n=1 Tax=Acorus gramineus TaxID=55184 RepID=A0AAV9BUE0_ACOGR|nr:hypothetical protein QJS04_geneDACA004846 [Acorus gramineus]
MTSFRSNYHPLQSHSTSIPLRSLIPPRNPLLHGFRHRRRRRLKLSASLEDLVTGFVSQLPSAASLDILAPAVGFVSGVAAHYFSSRLKRADGSDSEAEADVVGDWILFTSPTPFNRFVLLRCPTVSFEDREELLGGANERLVKEDRHFVNLDRGRIPYRCENGGECSEMDKLSYQRVCIGTDDGGVISLDWPAELDLSKELGLDTTMLIVPGTPEGSADPNVQAFVWDSLRHGSFPVVMNPRGCATSPLTTARLFTAADSDDICTAIQFLNSSRPWTALMGIGWGYGANMLTKYLGEVGERTPLTAAMCIDNPFDLEETTRSFPHNVAMGQKLTSGLINILQANKGLFQGKAKGFDVSKALSATSLREFEKAISMVSYGFEAIEDFYAKSSSGKLVTRVKIPVLFLQSDDGTVPLFSIPRSAIAENPFTSLLLCSCFPSSIVHNERSAIMWCQRLAIEWLSAVELALLKGRHPLLKDVDITINPSKGPTFVDGGTSKQSISTGSRCWGPDRSHTYLNHNENARNFKLIGSHALNEFNINPIRSMPEEGDVALADKDSISSRSDSGIHRAQRQDSTAAEEEEIFDKSQQSISSPVDAGSDGGGGGGNPSDSETSQVLPTATVVMNMLDVTMPGTLAEEQKKKVLTAMEQGESLMKALQGAVPDDVRGKLTAAASEILQTQKTNLFPNASSEVKAKIQGKIRGFSSEESGNGNTQSSDHKKETSGSEGKMQDDSCLLNSNEDVSTDSGNYHPGTEKSAMRPGSEIQPFSKDDIHSSVRKDSSLSEKTHDSDGFCQEKPNQASETVETRTEDGSKPTPQSSNISETQYADDQTVIKSNHYQNDEQGATEQNKPFSSSMPEEGLASEEGSNAHEGNGTGNNSENNNNDGSTQGTVDPNVQISPKSGEQVPSPPSQPSMSVSQALDALTGLDDSTQMAVNSVFGVIENMIDHFEKETSQENDGAEKEGNGVSSTVASEDCKAEKEEDARNEEVESVAELISDLHIDNLSEGHVETGENKGGELTEEKFSHMLDSSVNNSNGKAGGTYYRLSNQENSAEVRDTQNFPLQRTVNPFGNLAYNYFRTSFPHVDSNTKPLDLNTTTDLFLEYFPEEGQWKLIDQMGNTNDSIYDDKSPKDIDGNGQDFQQPLEISNIENIIEPSYAVLDTANSEYEHQLSVKDATSSHANRKNDMGIACTDELEFPIKNVVLDSLNVEVGRRLGMPDTGAMEPALASDLEQVAVAVSQAVRVDKNFAQNSESTELGSRKFGTINADVIIGAISSAVQVANHLRKVLPLGVIVGSSLAALRKYYHVASLHDEGRDEDANNDGSMENKVENIAENGSHNAGEDKFADRPEKITLNNDNMMVGAVTTALGASALLAKHQVMKHSNAEGTQVQSGYPIVKRDILKGHGEPEDAVREKNDQNLVSSLAEKAMSVAGPVVPTNSDGEVDHERLVAILADLGQKGGMLRLIGKAALLWGGIRGAMSLTDKLISFLHIADRPLFARILGFVFMVLVLWSPVVIPLLPTLVQIWTTKSPTGIAGYACILSLYVAVVILIALWGKRIRGFEYPLGQYGLDISSFDKVCELSKGFFGGAMLVACVHWISALLGFASFTWPFTVPISSPSIIMIAKTYGRMLLLAIRATVVATGVAIVEELLFRSWLPEELAVDTGYHQAYIISGFVFSLLQRSLNSIPGLWLLSLALFGAKQRGQGSLALPIGIRAGIITTNSIIQTGGFLTYRPNTPFWLMSTHPWHPFDGAVGLSLCAVLAIFLHPWKAFQMKKNPSVIQE